MSRFANQRRTGAITLFFAIFHAFTWFANHFKMLETINTNLIYDSTFVFQKHFSLSFSQTILNSVYNRLRNKFSYIKYQLINYQHTSWKYFHIESRVENKQIRTHNSNIVATNRYLLGIYLLVAANLPIGNTSGAVTKLGFRIRGDKIKNN